MAAPETGFFRGSGGAVFEFALPLTDVQQYQLGRGELTRVNEDGSPYAAETEQPKRPADTAAKAAWVGYARAVDPGLSIDDADAMTKNDLIEKYGAK